MALHPEGHRFPLHPARYEPDRNDAARDERDPAGYNFARMTVFSSTFGGSEAAVILEAEIPGD